MGLSMPTLPADPDFSDVANFLASSSSAIAAASQEFLDSLEELGNTDFASVGDLPGLNPANWNSRTILTGPPARIVIPVGNIQQLLDLLRQLVAPTSPNVVFSYTDPGYVSSLRDPVIAKLLFDLLNGGYGIDVTDEVALFNRTRDREAQLAQANVDEVKRQAASMSFSMPQGSLFEQLEKANQAYMAKISSANRDITLERSKLFVENRQFTIEKVLASEDQSIGLYNAIQERTLRAAEIQVQLAISLFDSATRLFALKIDAIKSQIDAQLATTRTAVEIYASDVAAYAALVNAVMSQAYVDIANSRTTLERDVASHRARTDIVRFKLEQLALTVTNRKDIDKYATDFFRTGFGSAINGINGLAVDTKDLTV